MRMEHVLFIGLLLTGVHVMQTSAYLTDWNMVGSRLTQPMCVDIPQNLTLCHGIGYTQMRLPNLLGHDTMIEVGQQAGPWVPLFNLKCHPDTQLFLCSLFSPVCLDRPIYPCRSLCEAVRKGCERRMNTYGYPWPDMVRCDQFPLDNDMCITVQSTVEGVVKTSVQKLGNEELRFRKAKIFKMKEGTISKSDLKAPVFEHPNMSRCCGELIEKLDTRGRVLAMGVKKKGSLFPTLIIPWEKTNKAIRKVQRTMKKFNCSNPQALSRTMLTRSKIPVRRFRKIKRARRPIQKRRGKKEIPDVKQSAPVWCAGCKQPLTLRNLLSKFCAADFVIKTRIRRIINDKMKCRRSRILSFKEDLVAREELAAPTFVHPNMTDCCGEMLDSMKDKKNRVIIMGDKSETGLKTNLVIPWGNNTRLIKRTMRVAKKKKCPEQLK
ncbi:secreted frizzled-related protein 5-like [Limulus polyphemus]|uniref:Secreted frizzled-related protein 5-like n=1 Tax=Limulus polyphemus TaxID=6850 RepID=A0ABM1BSR2_LIMPO|nr:secreted frizzled-related protein 5-like [Limulus polyphemus]